MNVPIYTIQISFLWGTGTFIFNSVETRPTIKFMGVASHRFSKHEAADLAFKHFIKAGVGLVSGYFPMRAKSPRPYVPSWMGSY